MDAQAALQAQIAAQETLDAIVYGQRTLQAMGGKAYGITEEWGAAGWAIAQWAAATAAAAKFGEMIEDGNAEWRLRKAKKAAQAELAAAKDRLKAIGTKRQQRLALAEMAA